MNDKYHTENIKLHELIVEQRQEIELLKSIIAKTPCNIYWKDKNGYYMGCSDKNLEALGCKTKKEFIGKKIHELISQEYGDRVQLTDDQVMSSGEELTLEEDYLNNTEELRTFISHKIPLFDDNGNVIGLLGASFDITERKKMELELKETKELAVRQSQISHIFINNIIANLPENFYWMDTKGNIIGSNENQAQVFGLNSAELLGKNIYDIAEILNWDRRIPDAIQKNTFEVIENKRSKKVEEIVIINGEIKTFLSYKYPMLDDQNQAIGVFGVGIDITERKRIEEELKAAKEKAERANEAVSIFAKSMAHELRTPLATLHGYIFGIKKYLPSLLEGYQLAKQKKLDIPSIRPEHYQSLLTVSNHIENEINHANSVIDMILFRADPDKLKHLDLKTCSIKQCIALALARYPFNATEKNLIHWDEDGDFIFLGEELFTIHILFNLLKNALYHIAKTSKGEISIWFESGKDFNYFYFKDTSKGISPDILSRIFDLYFSDTPHGTGVGLAFCKQVMEIFSGDIECRSEEGHYTQFILKFPAIHTTLSSGEHNEKL